MPAARWHALAAWPAAAGAAGWPALPLAGWTTDGPRSVSRRSVVAPPPPPDGRGRWRAAAAMLRMHLPASANSGSVLRQPRHLPERPQARRRQKAAPRGTQERATKHGKNGPVGGLRAGDAAGWPRGCFRWITALTAAARPPGLGCSSTRFGGAVFAGRHRRPCRQDSGPAGGRQSAGASCVGCERSAVGAHRWRRRDFRQAPSTAVPLARSRCRGGLTTVAAATLAPSLRAASAGCKR